MYKKIKCGRTLFLIFFGTLVSTYSSLTWAGFPGNLIDEATGQCQRLRTDVDNHRRRINEDINALNIRIESMTVSLEAYESRYRDAEKNRTQALNDYSELARSSLRMKALAVQAARLSENLKSINFQSQNSTMGELLRNLENSGGEYANIGRKLSEEYNRSNAATSRAMSIAIRNATNSGIEGILSALSESVRNLANQKNQEIEEHRQRMASTLKDWQRYNSQISDLVNDRTNLYSALEEQNRRRSKCD